MKRNFVVILLVCFTRIAFVQENSLSRNYVGLLPSVLVEPYDSIKAVEVNICPILVGKRFQKENKTEIQFRTILNYRFFHSSKGISQVGGTILINRYFLHLLKDESWLKPQIGGYCTYAFNVLDRIQALTVGIEPGVYLQLPKKISISLSLQPGINYYPDSYSQDFVEANSGFKSHFGFIFHFGYNF